MTPFELVTGLVKNIITAVEQSAVATVRVLTKHTFPTRVTNFPKMQDIKGTIIVGNQGRVEKQLQKEEKLITRILESIRGIQFPKTIKVDNFPNPPMFPKEFKVTNFPDPIKPLPYPTEMSIKNQPVLELKNLLLEGMALRKAVGRLKLDPVIRVEAPEPVKVVVPAPQVTVNEKEIDYEKLAKAVGKEIPEIDYTKLAEAIGKKLAASIVSTGGGGGSKYSFQKADGERTYGLVNVHRQLSTVSEERWGLMNTAKIDTTTYTGEQDVDQNWIIRKIIKVDSEVTMSYATVKNNPSVTTYADAWTDKATLTYNDFATAFAP